MIPVTWILPVNGYKKKTLVTPFFFSKEIPFTSLSLQDKITKKGKWHVEKTVKKNSINCSTQQKTLFLFSCFVQFWFHFYIYIYIHQVLNLFIFTLYRSPCLLLQVRS